MWLYTLVAALQEAKIAFAIVGGYAVALHGAVRGTVDVDIVLRLAKRDFIAAEEALRRMGLQPRLPVSGAEVFDFREEYIKNRNLVAWSFYNQADPSQIVDILITHDLAKVKMIKITFGGHSLPVIALTDLIAMKKASGRPQDLADIRALEALRK
jgi:hypothetical protein